MSRVYTNYLYEFWGNVLLVSNYFKRKIYFKGCEVSQATQH